MCLNALQAIWSWISEQKFCEWPHYLKDFMAKPIQKRCKNVSGSKIQKKQKKVQKQKCGKSSTINFLKGKLKKNMVWNGLKCFKMHFNHNLIFIYFFSVKNDRDPLPPSSVEFSSFCGFMDSLNLYSTFMYMFVPSYLLHRLIILSLL